jgi:Trypsin-like peptidase domain/FHA domain
MMDAPRGPACCLALLATLSCITLGCAAAADPTQMKDSTVRIVCAWNGLYYAGSGFVLGMDTRTYVATNQHVVYCADKGEQQALFIVLSRSTGRQATIVWSDDRTDLAIISVSGSLGRPPVTLADTADLTEGEPVTVVGFPGAADKLVQSDEMALPSVFTGTISLVVTSVNGVRYFEYYPLMVPGNSGGPVFNDAGEVIGIVSMREIKTGLGAAVDVSELIPHLRALEVPYSTASMVTGMSTTVIILSIAVILLFSAGGVLIATSSGRALLSGNTTRFTASHTEARAARLRVLSGPLQGMETPILDRVILGRDPAKAHVVYPESDALVSRRHCEIVFDSARMQFEVRDLGSRNGTFVVRGKAASRRLVPEVPERLEPGDKVLVGSPRNSLVLELA